nr:putative short-chain fatty acid transporter [Nerophis lumbriciformis]
MFESAGKFFAEEFKKWLPDSFVFAILLTILFALLSIFWVDASPNLVVDSWYKGFWLMLEFGMQMVLILATGSAIALSPPASRLVDFLSQHIKTPTAVYVSVFVISSVLVQISWSWTVIVAVLARELAKRVGGIDYAYLVAVVYFASGPWVCGFSSSIPLLLNTEGNFLIAAGLLSETIPLESTLFSQLNGLMLSCFVFIGPFVMLAMRPKKRVVEMKDLMMEDFQGVVPSVAEEAESYKLARPTLSDGLNFSTSLQMIIALMGVWAVVNHFRDKGFEIDLNIMIFMFIVLGLIFHLKPMRYLVAMRRACSNISGIVFQYPFYAGIMGIMMFTGLGQQMSVWMAGFVSLKMLPFAAFILGGMVNFAIPSAGGEWAVIGPALVESAHQLGAGMSPDQMTDYIARIAMAVAYGESLTNSLQPFFLLVILPVLGAGVRIQARDVMGYVFVPFLFFLVLESLLIIFVPV